MYTCVYTHILHTYMQTSMYMYMYENIYIHVHTHTYIYIHTNIFINGHTYTYVYIHNTSNLGVLVRGLQGVGRLQILKLVLNIYADMHQILS